ncbi:hypothetical protein J4G52_24365 [Burkholderia cenocepacia]|uniref:hypothetical protein n=1 Tax=Burkholderia cenocepacia TaxID=95486 RepID=UPI001AA12E33|nr:hypothetical protein [Burkholderia cenocepacia]MBO1856676.1 hypothetical protein [Burkholderia cenocepacia]
MNKQHLIALMFGFIAVAGAHAADNPVCTESEMAYQHVGTDSQVKVEMQEYRDGKQVAAYGHVEGIDTSNIDPAAKKLRVRVCVESVAAAK